MLGLSCKRGAAYQVNTLHLLNFKPKTSYLLFGLLLLSLSCDLLLLLLPELLLPELDSELELCLLPPEELDLLDLLLLDPTE